MLIYIANNEKEIVTQKMYDADIVILKDTWTVRKNRYGSKENPPKGVVEFAKNVTNLPLRTNNELVANILPNRPSRSEGT